MKRLSRAKSSSKPRDYRFDISALESQALQAHKVWELEDSRDTRTHLFIGIRDLAYAILMVGNYGKFELDYEETAYEYALYLFDRLVFDQVNEAGEITKARFRLIPQPSKKSRRAFEERGVPLPKYENQVFPLQDYIRKNIRHIIMTLKTGASWSEVLTQMEDLVNDNEFEKYTRSCDPYTYESKNDLKLDRRTYGKILIQALRVYYTYSEIRRLLHVSLEVLLRKPSPTYSNLLELPEDIRDFCILLLAVSKRIVKESNLSTPLDVSKRDLQKIFKSSVSSTVFLSTVINSALIPKELLLALDIDSLHRLVNILGGKSVKIPTSRDLDSVYGAVTAVSDVILNGKEPKKALQDAKIDLDLVFASHVNMTKFVSKAIETYNVFKHERDVQTQPIIGLLVMSIKSLDTLFKSLETRIPELPVETILKSYTELSTSFSRFSEAITNLRNQSVPEGQDV